MDHKPLAQIFGDGTPVLSPNALKLTWNGLFEQAASPRNTNQPRILEVLGEKLAVLYASANLPEVGRNMIPVVIYTLHCLLNVSMNDTPANWEKFARGVYASYHIESTYDEDTFISSVTFLLQEVKACRYYSTDSTQIIDLWNRFKEIIPFNDPNPSDDLCRLFGLLFYREFIYLTAQN